jgi:hypothetical protein
MSNAKPILRATLTHLVRQQSLLNCRAHGLPKDAIREYRMHALFLGAFILILILMISDSVYARVFAGATYTDTAGMTDESCILFCEGKGFIYAGTEYSHECCKCLLCSD